MAKGPSVQSSAVASRQSSPHENGQASETIVAPEQQAHVESANKGSPSPGVVESNKPVDANVAMVRGAESQPMTASTSTSSNRSSKDADGAGLDVPVTYGTRSRHRNGGARPNYAEDKELEVDFDVAVSAKAKNGRKSAPQSHDSTTTTDVGRHGGNSRKSAVTEQSEQQGSIRSHSKEPIPGTSTFSAKPVAASTSQPSKKRKAGAQTTANASQPPIQNAPQNLPVAQPVAKGSNNIVICRHFRESNMLTFDTCGARLQNKKLVADDGTVLEVNDHVYLVCEPPGEPYYLGRIMEFLHVKNDPTQPIEALRLNWYYRPKDIMKRVPDTRQVFASMHSDICPLPSLRGKCHILHRSEFDILETVRRTPDTFWFEKLFDRYIQKTYDIIPTSQVINVPERVKRVLDERWKYILVEPGRGKELTGAVKSCKRCSGYCASNDSVDCAVCRNTYHMSCVSPPLQKKPSRGFAWACGPCGRAQEKKLEARNTPNINGMVIDGEDEELNDDDEEFTGTLGDGVDTGRTTPNKSSDADFPVHPGTAEQIHQASMWLWRYLGIHCKVEDALDYDDRIYPRAGSRLGPRHQANVPAWPGRPVEYVKPVEIKKKYVKGGSHKKGSKLTEETINALAADKLAREQRPKWVMDEPPGYVPRGEDYDNDDPRNTAKLLFKLPEVGEDSIKSEQDADTDANTSILNHQDESDPEKSIDEYMKRAAALAQPLGLPAVSTNLLDVALEQFYSHGFDSEKALAALSSTGKKTFKEPDLSPAEMKKFEDGVSKYGSEWYNIKKHVKTVSSANIVRLYYTWKKTARGKQIWGSYSGRKGKKEVKKVESNNTGKLQDDVADDLDDSSFDNDKAFAKKRGFQCKFCGTRHSRIWRRAPNTAAGTTILDNPNAKSTGKDKGVQLTVALCKRCAELWRRYGIQWEDVEEVSKKVAQTSGRSWKRKIDEELLKELTAANLVTNDPPPPPPQMEMPPMPAGGGIAVQGLPYPPQGPEPPKKKLKSASEREIADHSIPDAGVLPAPKKKAVVEKPVAPPPPPRLPTPDPPKARILPCAICHVDDPTDQPLSCKDCRMSVHKSCYGVVDEVRSDGKWVCAMCANDRNPQVSLQYKCTLCPVQFTEQDFVGPLIKTTHKKKTEKDRERERVEHEKAIKDAEFFKKKQEEANKPTNPREPMKRTANNNWVHVTCAVFTPEVKFGTAKALEPAENIPSIPPQRYDDVCKVCKKKGPGACVSCHCCKAPVHVECANQAGFILGFDITPVKKSRHDQFNIVSMNMTSKEVGNMTAVIWCQEHLPTKSIVYRIHDIDEETKLSALQLYTQNFKQADLSSLGTARKATLISQSTKVTHPNAHATNSNRRASTTATANGNSTGRRGSVSHVVIKEEEGGDNSSDVIPTADKRCITCEIDVTPRWHPYLPAVVEAASADPVDIPSEMNGDKEPHTDGPSLTNGYDLTENGGHVALAAAALQQNTQLPAAKATGFQCHKCHIKKVRLEPSPVASVMAPSPEPPRPQATPTPPPVSLAPTEATAPQAPAQYQWPAPPVAYTAYPVNPSYNSDWAHHQSPAPQSIPQVGYVNGNHSPHTASGSQSHPMAGPGQSRQQHQVPQSPHGGSQSHPLNGPPQARQPQSQAHHIPQSPHNIATGQPAQQLNGDSQIRQPPPVPQSPRQNGQIHSPANGIGISPSSHLGMATTAINLANGIFNSYPSSRPHHLTNGGPPPRANEHPFSQPNPPMHTRPNYGGPHGSPSTLRDQQVQGRDLANPQHNGARQHDGRINGGASASPSLRNLLS